MNLGKKIFLLGWLLFLMGCIGYYVSHTNEFTPRHISEFISKFEGHLLLAYFMISFLRGFTLIPSTPFVIAGVLLFPENKIIVLLISLGGILFSATLLYYLSEFLGFDSYFEKIAPERVNPALQQKSTALGGFYSSSYGPSSHSHPRILSATSQAPHA